MFSAYCLHIFGTYFVYILHIPHVEVFVMAYFMHICCILLHMYCICIAYFVHIFCMLNAKAIKAV